MENDCVYTVDKMLREGLPMTAEVDARTDPAEILARLTGPGGEFELVEDEVLGARMPVFENRWRSLAEVLAAASRYGDRDYLITAGHRITYAEHTAAVASVAAEFSRRYGIGKGDRVAILAANSPEWIVAFWAATSLGAITVGFNAWWSAPEIEYAIGHSTPSVLIADSKRTGMLTDSDIPVLTIEQDLPRLMAADPAAELPETEIDEDDPAVIVYTSGTTGRSKGATHSHRNMIATIDYHRLMDAFSSAFGRPPGARRYLLSMPLFHIASLHNVAVPRLATGATVVMHQGAFDATSVLRLVERERVTNWTVVPTMARRLLEHGDLSRYDLSALSSFSLASAPSSETLKQRLRDALPAADTGLVDSYGLTESCTGATVAAPQELKAFPGTVGSPVPAMRVQIRGADGDVLPDGEEGEVFLRGPYVMVGYWNDPAATASAIDADRWLRTGDIGCLREGRLYLTSRRSDLILRGGENVYPVEIEQCLEEHPDIEECAVIGVDHPELGQEPLAIVVVSDPRTVEEGELSAFAAQRLAYFKVPARWRITADRLPRNSTGKVIRHQLRS